MKKSHTTLDDNDKVETKKRSTYYDISASSTKKKVPELKFERKKRDRIKKKVILQKSRNIILHPLPKFVGLSIVKKKM